MNNRRRKIDSSDAQRLSLELQFSEVNRLIGQLEDLSAKLSEAAKNATTSLKKGQTEQYDQTKSR